MIQTSIEFVCALISLSNLNNKRLHALEIKKKKKIARINYKLSYWQTSSIIYIARHDTRTLPTKNTRNFNSIEK